MRIYHAFIIIELIGNIFKINVSVKYEIPVNILKLQRFIFIIFKTKLHYHSALINFSLF